jgi:NTP pyrophosphatase (non-canonical NTP hydrolase)
MNSQDYIKEALRTEPDLIDSQNNNISFRIEHAAMGIATESGEIMDAVKKAKICGEKLDKVNLIEEAGDLMWYLAILADELGVTFENIWEKNIAKLKTRFPDKYNSENAKNRDLKKERDILEK